MTKALIKALFAKIGFEIRRQPAPAAAVYRPGLNAFADQRELFSAMFPQVVFDIGAHHGQITARYRTMFPQAKVYCFEPFPSSCAQLQSRFANDPLVALHELAVSDQDSEEKFFSNRADYTNSLLACDAAADSWVPSDTTESLETITVTTCMLDTFCEQHNIQRIDILKTDVQGAELRLLQGARRLLSEKRVSVLYLEVLFAPLYQGQTDFCELLDFLRSTGYRLVGIYNINRGRNGLAGWGDGLFVREDFVMPDCFRQHHALA